MLVVVLIGQAAREDFEVCKVEQGRGFEEGRALREVGGLERSENPPAISLILPSHFLTSNVFL